MRTRLLVLVPLAICGCNLGDAIEAAGTVAGCVTGDAIGGALAPPDRVGEAGLLEADVACPQLFPFTTCPERPLALGAIEDLAVYRATAGVAAPTSVQLTDQNVLSASGFEPLDEACAGRLSGSLHAIQPGEAALVVLDTAGAEVDRFAFRVEPVGSLELVAEDTVRVGEEIFVAVDARGTSGAELQASRGHVWELAPAGVAELTTDPAAFRLLAGVAPGIVELRVSLGGVTATATITVVP